MKDLFRKIKVWFALRKADKELREAILRAEAMFRLYNKRFYVIPDTHHQLRVFSYAQLKQMKKQGLFSPKVKESDFIDESFYYTPSNTNGLYMNPKTKEKKRQMWKAYYKMYRL